MIKEKVINHSGRERGHRVVPIRFPTRCVQNSNFWTKYVEMDYKLNFCKLFFFNFDPPLGLQEGGKAEIANLAVFGSF